MDPKKLAKVVAWLKEELSFLEEQGATIDIFHEPAFLGLVADRVLERHFKDIEQDPELMDGRLRDSIREGSPEFFRKTAAMARERGMTGLAYDFEKLADERERGNE